MLLLLRHYEWTKNIWRRRALASVRQRKADSQPLGYFWILNSFFPFPYAQRKSEFGPCIGLSKGLAASWALYKMTVWRRAKRASDYGSHDTLPWHQAGEGKCDFIMHILLQHQKFSQELVLFPHLYLFT